MQYFGTDGIRGKASELFTYDFLVKISKSISIVLKEHNINKICIGQDPRISSDYISNTLIGTLLYEGIDVENLGVVSTPGVSYTIINDKNINLGIMISASHNPYTDNGIKLFGEDGKKISEALEIEIEKLLTDKEQQIEFTEFGRLNSNGEFLNNYINYVKGLSTDLSGKVIAFDCSNGSASKIAPNIFESLGAEVITIAKEPDGYNINKNVGSTHPESLSDLIKNSSKKIDFGFAYDGDADRVMLFNSEGQVLDGDYILYILAKYLKEENKLKDLKVVITVMANLGFKKALEDLGINYEECQVGDKYVMRELEDKNLSLGGEQSGHIILPGLLPTGDGILVSAYLAKIITEQNLDLVNMINVVKKYPQKLVNIKVTNKTKIIQNKELLEEIGKIEQELQGDGRVLVRPSGTENLVRVMVESKKMTTCDIFCDIIIEKIKYLDRKGE